jgi:hypothetical protein
MCKIVDIPKSFPKIKGLVTLFEFHHPPNLATPSIQEYSC